MANNNLPNIVSELTDYNLNTSRVVDLGDSVLIIGTSAWGPVNQPIRVLSPADAEEVFGSISDGNLVRGYSEVYYGPGGTKDIRLCRVSNGQTGTLDITEKLSSSLEEYPTYDGSDKETALTLSALYPGDVYNSVTIRQEVVNGQLSVVLYNPISGVNTVIPYDKNGNVAGAVKNVTELEEAINTDTNMSKVVKASVADFDTTYEFTLTSSDVGTGEIGELTGSTLLVDLGVLLGTADANDDGYTEDTTVVSPSGIPVTAGNGLVELTEVYEKINMAESLDSFGLTQVLLDYPVQMTGAAAVPLLDCTTLLASGGGTAKHVLENAYIGNGDGIVKTFSFTAYEAIDPLTFHLYRANSSGTQVEIAAAQYTLTSVGGALNDETATVVIKVASPAPSDGSVITVSYTTVAFDLTQSVSLQACQASSSYKTYFIAGDRVTFGTAQPADMEVAYAAKKIYDIDTDVVIYNAASGKIQFANVNKQPAYDAVGGTDITISYKYQPEWLDIGTGALSITGGTNGIEMPNAKKYKLLTDLYEDLEDYDVDCIVLMETYLDDTKIVYDSETGLPVEENAGFQTQFAVFLESLQDGVNETYGIMAVKPAASISLDGITSWYTNLTETSLSSRTRAANAMYALSSKHLNIVTFESVIINPSVASPYTTTSEAIYAGLVCKLPITSAPTNKEMGSQVYTCRYKLSAKRLDNLTSKRYVTTRLNPDNTWSITDDITAAGVGSDYKRLSTVRIVFAAMDVVREKGRPFIGELFNAAKRAALETAIENGLHSLQEVGALKKYDYRIEQTSQERVAGIARINLVLYPEFELVRIETTVKLSNAE